MTTATIDPAEVQRRADRLSATLATLRGQLAERQATTKPPDAPKSGVVMNDRPVTIQKSANADRPSSIDEMVGQSEVTMQLRTVIAGAILRGTKVPNILISGSPGYGKSSLAAIVASEIGCPMVSTTGMLMKKVSDVIGLISSCADGPAVLFIDECHQMSKAACEVTYQVMEDSRLDLLAGTGPDAQATTRELPDLVIVAATTQPGKLAAPWRDRFGAQFVMVEYSDDELSEIIARFWKARKVQVFKGETLELARRSRGTPRRAIALANRVLDYVAVNDQPGVTTGTVANACGVFGVDDRGHDDVDRRILAALTGPFSGKAVGLDSLAAFLDMEPSTIQDQHESFLVRGGYVVRTGRGRTATAAAYELMRS